MGRARFCCEPRCSLDGTRSRCDFTLTLGEHLERRCAGRLEIGMGAPGLRLAHQ